MSDLTTYNRIPLFVQGETAITGAAHETFRWNVSKTKVGGLYIPYIEGNATSHQVDISWLADCADTYKISADPSDYVLAEVPIVTVDVPNRNMDCFPYQSVSDFSTYLGNIVYKTFIRKPTYLNHANKNPALAKGVNFDAAMKKIGNVWKIIILSGFDRTKDANLAQAIADRKRTKFSMGAFVDYTKCSLHGKQNGPPPASCCRYKKFDVVNGKLRYDLCYGVNFIENSSVDDPADVYADAPEIWA